MNEKLKELAEQAEQYAEYTTPQGLEWLSVFKEKFAELILQAASDHIMESSDRYRKEYFADKVLKTFDGDGEYEIGTMEGLKEFEEKRNGNGS
jgi:hypothetical protein